MHIFFDTSVLVASAVRHHPHHLQAARAVAEVLTGSHTGFIAAHSLAETYAVLTRLPLQPMIHPSEARRIIEENVLPHFQVLSLAAKDYRELIREIAEAGVKGGAIYDALLLLCARKKRCERIYTFNVVQFERLAPDLGKVICAPA